jgi:3-phenylpropionate/trans-cinnamate dioxygenase ferredoxin component
VSEGIKVATTDAVPGGEGIAIPKAVTGTDDDMGASVDRFGTRPTVWNNLCYIAVATLLTGAGEAAG